VKVLTRKQTVPADVRPASVARIALSYCVFLLLCLALGLGLYLSMNKSARDDFWNHHGALLGNSVITMDHYLATVDSYTRQLTNDSTFIRFSNMDDLMEQGYITTAYSMMRAFTSRAFSLANVPITETHVYLKNTGYVISASQFTEVRQFYMDYNSWQRSQYQNWLNLLASATATEQNYDTSVIYGIPGQFTLIRNIDDLFSKSVPAIIWFDWDIAALQKQFTGYVQSDSVMLVAVSPENQIQLILQGKNADAQSLADLKAFALAMKTGDTLGDYHILHSVSSRNSWRYCLAIPRALCAQTLQGADTIFFILFSVVLLGGIVIIVLQVRHYVQPIRQLGSKLAQAQDIRAQLETELDSYKPFLYSSYLRRVLSGHIASETEFGYIMDFLGINAQDLRYMVLYCCAYTQDERDPDGQTMARILTDKIVARCQTNYPAYTYITLDNHFVTLVTYGPKTADPLMDLQTRVVKLHDELLAQYGIWFYAGVGTLCTHPLTLWESYEQARVASRYAAKNHVFLPYELIGKNSTGVFYPIEISVKLLHFITTGNRQQVAEMFALIYRENFVERSLPLNMLNYLLSDIRNTLMRARFSITAEQHADDPTLRQIDEHLAQQATLPLCESAALALCGFFAEAAKPSNPIPEIKDYLEKNYSDPSICLSMLSHQFHISESYLSHKFKEKAGENLSAYLETLRLNEAAKRLMYPERYPKRQRLNINSLYMEVGYNNAVTFRRAFKKRFGITPSEMRAGAKAKKP